MRVLLTGHEGFVGTHLRWALAGDDITCVDVKAGFAPGQDCLDFFREQADVRYDLAIHCAATVGGRSKIDGSPLAVATNLALDSMFFRWLETSGTPQAVYFSSSAAYPVSLQQAMNHRPLREDDITLHDTLAPDATYGLAKLTGERLAEELVGDCSVLIPRPFSGYGPGQSLDYPFPSFIERARRREDPFTIWGDGTAVRDFIHIDDIVNYTLKLARAGVSGPVNFGTGLSTSFDELAEMVCGVVGYRPTFDHILSAPTGVAWRVADPTYLFTFKMPMKSLGQGIVESLR